MVSDEIIVGRYKIKVISFPGTYMKCECGKWCSVILQLPDGTFEGIPCPNAAIEDLAEQDYSESLREAIFIPLYSSGLVRTTLEPLFLRLYNFVKDFTRTHHLANLSNLQTVPISFVTVSVLQADAASLGQAQANSLRDSGLGWVKRATRESVRGLVGVKAGELEMGSSCVICVEGLRYEQEQEEDEIVRMPCRHVFHRDCIAGWLDNSHVCPLCRFEMPFELMQTST